MVIVYSSLTYRGTLGQFMAGELSQHQAIEALFSNQTWGNLPNVSEIDQLPLASTDYMLVRHWGSPNIWVSLILFMVIRVSEGGIMGVASRDEWAWSPFCPFL